ncbi:hypothetical protein N6H05_01770 [Sphingobium sp. WTD-1]|uniref:hypothetical protein n=1 Tax=Sphingobium sp. WTD-1 TaxID=2979467 RepID=UPI0024DE3339|nr:hypothetical protein [Sphingobium sp. WTD-1]WIA56578.1 hypothetical protein N6H05_01770 [Sphingobium sp. WTD-1]
MTAPLTIELTDWERAKLFLFAAAHAEASKESNDAERWASLAEKLRPHGGAAPPSAPIDPADMFVGRRW